MTTRPKARKFRIRRNDPVHPDTEAMQTRSHAPIAPTSEPRPSPAPEDLLAAPDIPEDGFGDLAMPGSTAAVRRDAQAASTGVSADQNPASAQELAAIRAEGLTGRQLRMARRVAQKNGLAPTSDFDAVRLLRARGLDPFAQSNMLDLVVDDARRPTTDVAKAANLPVTTKPVQPPAPPRTLTADDRAAEIMKVQRDIARRRRKRVILLASRLSMFVLLPTLLVAYYFYVVATPLFAT